MKHYFRAMVCFLFVTAIYAAAQVVAGDNLVVEGIPPIPSDLAESVARYTNGREAEMLDWHPTRREMLIVTFFGDIPQIHQVKFPGGARTQLTFFADNPARGVSYHPTTGDYFIFSKDVGGDQNFQTYRYDFSTCDVTLLTDGKSKNSPGIWSHAGDRIVYGSSRRNGKDVDLYIMDPSNPASNRMLAQLEGGGWTALDWSPDDGTILALDEISANESYLWSFDVVSGAKTLLTPKSGNETVSYGAGQFSRDGKGIYVTTDRSSEFQRLAYIDLQTHQYTFLTDHIKWDIQEFKLSPDGKLIGVTANEDGLSVLHLIDARTAKDIHLADFPVGYVFGALRWHKSGRYLGFSMDSVRSPADAYALDTKTLTVERWTHSESGTVNTDSFVEPKIIRWKSFDGFPLSGFLYHPPAKFAGKRPVVIDIHGGPEDQFQPYFQGRDNYLMNELGVAVLHPNIRGSSGYGKEFLKLDNGYLRENSYKDIGTLLDWVKTQPDLDADRVMVTGVSYGGHMALAVAARYSDLIRCAIDVVGPANLVTFLENTAAYRQDLRRVEYGDERDPKMRAFLEKIAPLNNAAKITKPLFIVQGMNDPIVPRSESEAMVAAVRKNGTLVWYLMAKDEGHGFFKKKNSDFQFYATVLFMKEYLLK